MPSDATPGGEAKVRSVVGERQGILVASAGLYKASTLEETTVDEFDELFAVNVRAPFFTVQQLLPIMGDGSSIVLISSLAGRAAFGAAYPAIKGALDTLVKHFAFALGARGIRVNGVAPGLVAKESEDSFKTNQRRTRALSMQALQRLAEPDDIADVVAFLASDDSHWMTGDTVRADGGSML